ncbi:MAG: flagellar biosynthesis protein FlhB [Rectinemataceae bacterium]|jgi:flagellar biosynthetic protein FlhB
MSRELGAFARDSSSRSRGKQRLVDAANDPRNIGLQWFAAEDEGRTEEPSELKLRKAREEGRVAKSQELVGAVGLLFPAVALVLLGPYFAGTMRDMLVFYLGLVGKADIARDSGPIVAAFFSYFARLTLPIAAVAVIGAIFSNVLQVGFVFSVKPITPDFSKIVPRFGQYFKRTLFSVEGLFNFAKSLMKIIIIGVISYLTIQGEFDKLRRLFEGPFWPSIAFIFSLTMRLVIEVAAALIALAIPDYLFQRRQYMESLKMSKQEVKEERKMQEGDPLVKSRLRERMRELLLRNMAVNVPKADVVITNPTHYAIALEWDREKMPAPTVTAKGVDEVAQRIKRIAAENGVPLVENRPLARALYADVEIGDSIPDKYYQAIAAVLAHIYGQAAGEVLGNATSGSEATADAALAGA